MVEIKPQQVDEENYYKERKQDGRELENGGKSLLIIG